MQRKSLLAMCLLLALAAVAHAVTPVGSQLRLNQQQVLGSHNSYRPYPSPWAAQRIEAALPGQWRALAYGHPPLESQLALGIMQFEIDVAADPHGGLYAAPYADGRAPAATLAMMRAPGAKVLHIPGIDYETHCLTFRACLAIFARWSQQHPEHAPLVVLVNAVDFDPEPGIWPHRARFDQATLDALDEDIRAVMGAQRVITPDDVRAAQPTLRDAVRHGGWPTLAQARGRVLFVLDGSPRHLALYRTGHPSLTHRMMFGWYADSEPEAAVLSVEDPLQHQQQIRDWVAAGFIVRTRADDGADAVSPAQARLRAQAAWDSGAQWISSDHYPGVPDPQGLQGEALRPPGRYCDPVSAACLSDSGVP